MHFYDQTPPLIKSPNKGANQIGSSWGIQTYVYYLLEAAQKISGDPPPNFW